MQEKNQDSWQSVFQLPKLLELVECLLNRAHHEGVLVELSVHQERGYTIEVRQQDIDTLEHHQGRSLQLTVYQGAKTAEVSSSDFSLRAIDALFDKSLHILKVSEEDPWIGLADRSLMAFGYPDLQLYHPWALSPSEAIQAAKLCERQALAVSQDIVQSEGVSLTHLSSLSFYANSQGFIGYYPMTDYTLSCGLLARSAVGMQRDHEYTRACSPAALESWDWLAESAAQKTLLRLKQPGQIKTGIYPVIFHHGVAKSLWGHFLSAISGTQLYRQASFLCDALGQEIFSRSVNLYQKPHLLSAMGSCPFDSDGVRTQELGYIRSGYLEHYALGEYAARRLGLKTTGNANGVHNLIIEMPTVPYRDLLAQMDTGLLITELMGQGVNIVTGDYSRGIFGYWVEGGEIVHAVEEVTVAGQLQEMFRSILVMGDDIDKRGNIQTGSLLLSRMMVAGR